MDEHEIKKSLVKISETVEENNKILKKIRSRMRWGSFLHVLYWVFIIGLSFGAYYFIQPFIESIRGTTESLSSGVNGLQEIGQGLPSIDSILKSLTPKP